MLYDDGRTIYHLEADYHLAKTGRYIIYGARMFNSAGTYIGYWYEFNMPQAVKRQLITHLVKEAKHRRMALPVRKANGR